jgi:hypothetical protein
MNKRGGEESPPNFSLVGTGTEIPHQGSEGNSRESRESAPDCSIQMSKEHTRGVTEVRLGLLPAIPGGFVLFVRIGGF